MCCAFAFVQATIRQRTQAGELPTSEPEIMNVLVEGVTACVVTSQLLHPSNSATEIQARVVASEVYADAGSWSDAQRHVTVALQAIEECEAGPLRGSRVGNSSLAFVSERPDPLKSTYKRRGKPTQQVRLP